MRAAKVREQASIKPRATNSWQRWTERDFQVATDLRMTAGQAASSLGRTPYAVRYVRHKLHQAERERQDRAVNP